MNAVTVSDTSPKGVATQGRKCRQRLSGAVVDGSSSMFAVARERTEKRSRGAQRRKPQAWELRIHWVFVDNKSVAEIGKRHLLLEADGAISVESDLE